MMKIMKIISNNEWQMNINEENDERKKIANDY